MNEPKRNTREYGLLQERKIIDALRRKPMNRNEISEFLGISLHGTDVYMHRLRESNRIRVIDYERRFGIRPRAIYTAGSGKSLEYVTSRVRKPTKEDRVQKNRETILEILATPQTAAEICEHIFVTHSRARKYIKNLRDEKLIHVSGWRQTGSRGGWAPLYKAGAKKDKARPRALTPAEHHAKARSNPAKRERQQEMRRMRDQVKKMKAKKTSPFALLGL